MLICGVKLTHDGGVALIDDGRLVFSVEMEKLENNPRHQRIDDLQIVFDTIRQFGYDPEVVEHYVFDGWRKTDKLRLWAGQEVRISLAPYRRGHTSTDLLRAYEFSVLDLPYLSFPHYAGHFASGYCSSPVAQAGGNAYVLCWDGPMFPYLYFFDAQARRVESLGPLFFLRGGTYHHLAQIFPPFTKQTSWAQEAALPGKIMAYAGLGTPRADAVAQLRNLYDRAVAHVLGTGTVPDAAANEVASDRIRRHVRQHLSPGAISAEDWIASIQQFMQDMLIESIEKRVGDDGHRSSRLVFAGGCALNIKWNSALRRSSAFSDVWVPPFPNDAGSAIGAAACAWLKFGDSPAIQWDTYAGPSLPPAPASLEGWTAIDCSLDHLGQWLHATGQPVVFLHGRSELGPRALGHRSIFCAPTEAATKQLLNDVKGREAYRPVAPICLEEHAPTVFEPGTRDPFMLYDHLVRPDWVSRVPAICHVDGTARLQTVSRADDADVYQVLRAYENASGIPLLCNTSANHSGRGFFPDVESAAEWGKIPHIWAQGRLYSRSLPG